MATTMDRFIKVLELALVDCINLTDRITNVKTLLRAFHLAEVANDPSKVYIVLPNRANDIIFKRPGRCYALLIWCSRWIWFDTPITAVTIEYMLQKYVQFTCAECNGSLSPLVWCNMCLKASCVRCHGLIVVPEPGILNSCKFCDAPVSAAGLLRSYDDNINIFTEYDRIQKRNTRLSMI